MNGSKWHSGWRTAEYDKRPADRRRSARAGWLHLWLCHTIYFLVLIDSQVHYTDHKSCNKIPPCFCLRIRDPFCIADPASIRDLGYSWHQASVRFMGSAVRRKEILFVHCIITMLPIWGNCIKLCRKLKVVVTSTLTYRMPHQITVFCSWWHTKGFFSSSLAQPLNTWSCLHVC